jgi:chemotaxis signal transduction protein
MSESFTKTALTNFDRVVRETGSSAANDQVEIVVALAAHQIFGLLMTQVINIVRPGPTGLQVISNSDENEGQSYGEILYQNNIIRVVELTRQLHLPMVEPIERSKILLTEQVGKNGRDRVTFGVAIDDIISLLRVNKADMRLLPSWLCAARLGKLVWGVVLMEAEQLAYDKTMVEYQNSALPQPFQLDSKKSVVEIEAASKETNQEATQLKVAEVTAAGSPKSLSLAERLGQRERKVEQFAVDNRRPLVLLDLQLLYPAAFPE